MIVGVLTSCFNGKPSGFLHEVGLAFWVRDYNVSISVYFADLRRLKGRLTANASIYIRCSQIEPSLRAQDSFLFMYLSFNAFHVLLAYILFKTFAWVIIMEIDL